MWPTPASSTTAHGNTPTRRRWTVRSAAVKPGSGSRARQWSATDAAPSFTYTDAAGVRHVVWYNDAESTRAKMRLIETYGVRGLAFWAVAEEDTRQWPILRSYAVQRSTKLTVTAPAAITYGTTTTVSGRLTTTAGAVVAGRKMSSRCTGC